MIILYRMASLILVTTLIGILLSSIWLVAVNGSRADLGTYLHIKELPGAEEKVVVDSYVLAYINYTYNTTDGKEVHFSEEKARYGEGRIMNVQGQLIHITSDNDVDDHTGCWPPLRGTKGYTLPGPGKPWIALIKRGMCTFEEKIKNAARHRAVGVIIYNEESSVSLEKMKINEKERNITAVFTYKYIGEEMAKIVEDGHFVWLSITEGQRGMKPMANINKTSVLFVSISFIVLMIISLVWLIFYYVQRFRYLQSKDQHSRHLCSVAKRIIMKIPTKSGKCEDKENGDDCCAICIEPYKSTDCIRVLPCNHEFHKNCIDPWLLEHRTCPMCKLDVLKHYGFVVGDPSINLPSLVQSSRGRNLISNINNSNNFNFNSVVDHSESTNVNTIIIDEPTFIVPESSSSSSSSSDDFSRGTRNSGFPYGYTASRQVTDV